MISLKNVSKTFVTESVKTHALYNVNLTINEGDFISIVGPSGSGKSTLLKVITGIYSLSSGSISYLDQNVSIFNQEKMAVIRGKNFGQIFQDFKLIEHLNVLDNILLPLRLMSFPITAQRKKRAEELMTKLGISERQKHYPSQLSGGQKQRVSIARALINSPKILLADEPTGNLDSANTMSIVKILEELNDEGMTILVVTHDTMVSSAAKKTIAFKDGQLMM